MSPTTEQQQDQAQAEHERGERERRQREHREQQEKTQAERRELEKREREERERIEQEFRQKEEQDRKEREESAKAFDEAVRSARERKKREWSRPKLGLVPLRLQAEPNPQHLKHIARSIHNVDPELLTCMRGCCSGQSPWPLFIQAQAGAGKTYSALALADHCGGASYYTVGDMCDQAEENDKFFETVPDQQLMILDDIGIHDKASEDRYDCLLRFLDHREGKPMICLSNLPPDTLVRYYDDRIISRLTAGTVVEMQGPDRREQGRSRVTIVRGHTAPGAPQGPAGGPPIHA